MTAIKPAREWVPLERLVRDPALQMRAGLADGLTDPATVERYREAMADGEEFPPLETVSDGQSIWLVDGFQRAAAIEGAGKGSAECLIYPGGYDDALLRALAANARHGLTRTVQDCRRAVATLLDTPRLLTRVLTHAADRGGVHRVLAITCGVSKSLVIKVLDDRGLRVISGKLVKKREATSAEAATAGSEAATACPGLLPPPSPPAEPSQPTAPAPPGPVFDASPAARDLERAHAAMKNLWAACRGLLDGPWATHVLRLAERHGVPFRSGNALDLRLTPGTEGLSTTAWWEPLGKVEAVLSDLSAYVASIE